MKKLLAFSLLITLISSCSEEKVPSVPKDNTPTKEKIIRQVEPARNFLIGKSLQLEYTERVFHEDEGGVVERPHECIADNTIKFLANGIYEFTDTIPCDDDALTNFQGEWKIEQQSIITSDGSSRTRLVISVLYNEYIIEKLALISIGNNRIRTRQLSNLNDSEFYLFKVYKF